MRRPVNPPYTHGDDTAAHARRGIGPASDYGVPIGTPVYAPFAVVRLERLGGTTSAGGRELRGYASNGDYWSVQHLSAYVARTSADEGAQVAWSGNTGTATSGPHVHAYAVISGRRTSIEDALASLAVETPAGGGSTPFPLPDDQEVIMEYGQIHCTSYPGAKYTRRAFYVPGTPYFVVWDSTDPKLANQLATRFKTGDSIEVSSALFDQFAKAAAAAA